jgi:uncharacterized protein (TIGR02246 family)
MPMPSLLEEKDAIRDVLAEYCFCIDLNRFADMAALFAEDGTWDTAFGKATGRPGIEALVRKIAGPSTPRERPIHAVSNIVIRVDGDRAEVQSNWVLVQNSGQGPRIGSAGAYADQMVKQNGRWFFHYRKIDRFIHD